MKIHKIVLYVIDFDELGASDIKSEMENINYANDCISPKIVSIETKDIGKWSDKHPLNNPDKCIAEFRKIFGIQEGLKK